jgi:hypothetical protein
MGERVVTPLVLILHLALALHEHKYSFIHEHENAFYLLYVYPMKSLVIHVYAL